MPAGYSVILKRDGTDGDIITGVDEWSEQQINAARNSLKCLASLRHQQYFANNRDGFHLSAVDILAPGHGLPVEIDWSQIQPSGVATMTARVRVGLKVDNVGVSVTGYVKRITGTPGVVLTFGPYAGTTWDFDQLDFPATETGVQQYEFYIVGTNATYGIRGMAVFEAYANP